MTKASGSLFRHHPFLIGSVALFLYLFSSVFLPAPCVAGASGRAEDRGAGPLSGPYAAGGTSFVQAATLAVEQVNAEGECSDNR